MNTFNDLSDEQIAVLTKLVGECGLANVMSGLSLVCFDLAAERHSRNWEEAAKSVGALSNAMRDCREVS